jgi:putative endonuclease
MKKFDKEWVVYILECSDKTLYTGITNNLKNRVKAHNEGVGAKYTKGRNPVKIMYTEKCPNRSDASKREREIKTLNRTAKLKLIETNNYV